MHLDGETLTVDQLAEAAYQNTTVDIFPEQAARVKASRDLLDGFVKSGRIIYGVTTPPITLFSQPHKERSFPRDSRSTSPLPERAQTYVSDMRRPCPPPPDPTWTG